MTMRVAHLLRKCDPAEWGGTESAVQRLLEGLRRHEVDATVFCPAIQDRHGDDPLVRAGWSVQRFSACLPVFGISAARRRQQIAVGGNLVSLDLPVRLWREPGLDLIHVHTLGRLGTTALRVARWRGVPLVATVHGGLLDLPVQVSRDLHQRTGGWEWGKLIGLLLGTKRFLNEADAILTCNTKEAELLRDRYPGKRIVVQPHGVPVELFQHDHRHDALAAFPEIGGRQVLLSVGRIDGVKNQGWLVEQMPAVLQRHPTALLVLAGACTDAAYGEKLKANIAKRGLGSQVLLTGGLPPGDPRLLGLMQQASAVILPSVSETFGLVILEAWAAGATVIASRTSGATALVVDGQNGRFFALEEPAEFHRAVSEALLTPERVKLFAAAGRGVVTGQYNFTSLAGRLKGLYAELIEKNHALRHPARRRHQCVDACRMP